MSRLLVSPRVQVPRVHVRSPLSPDTGAEMGQDAKSAEIIMGPNAEIVMG